MTTDTPTRRRWLPRFSLRTLLILLTLICCLFGMAETWYQSKQAAFLNELRIATEIKKLGGEVYWESNAPSLLKNSIGRLPALQQISCVNLPDGLDDPIGRNERIVAEVFKLPKVHVLGNAEGLDLIRN